MPTAGYARRASHPGTGCTDHSELVLIHSNQLMIRSLSLAAALTALASTATAQFQLCTFPTPFPGGNGGSSGWVVMYDINATAGLVINSIDCNCSSAANTAVTLEVYTTPGTYVGSQTNAGAWTLVSTDAGGVVTAGVGQATNFPLATPLILTPGSYGIGIRVIGSGQTYTNGNGSNQSVSDAFMTLSLGAAVAGLFTGTVNTPRVFNGCLHYTPANGLYSAFSASPTVGTSPLIVNFTDQTYTSDPNGVQTWAWDFDNNGTVDSNLQNPQWVYAAPGLYSVKLTTTDTANPSSTLTKTNYISVDPVSADFSGTPTLGAAPLIVNFTDLSTGPITSWAWDFDNNGTTDSNLQNPSWVYAAQGQYTVKLTVSNSGQSSTITKTDYIYATGLPVDPGTPDILQYQFNEPRGNKTANTATSSLGSALGTMNNTTWQGDPNRNVFSANEPGFGCLRYGSAGWVNTGAVTSFSGSLTIGFWMRKNAAAVATPFGYAFGNGTFRSFVGGAAGTGITFRGSAIGNVDSGFTVNGTPGVWQHVAVVIDNSTGIARWWNNGVPSATSVSFAPGTFAYTSTTILAVGAISTGGTSTLATGYDMDDFRMYGRALTGAELLGMAISEQPAASTFGTGCAGPGGIPTIGGSGGVPRVGNGSFTVDINNTEVGRVAAILIGVLAVDGGNRPLDVSFLFGAGCQAETLPDLAAFVVGVGPNNPFPLPIPNTPALAGGHVYCQGLVFGSSGAVTPALDINIQN